MPFFQSSSSGETLQAYNIDPTQHRLQTDCFNSCRCYARDTGGISYNAPDMGYLGAVFRWGTDPSQVAHIPSHPYILLGLLAFIMVFLVGLYTLVKNVQPWRSIIRRTCEVIAFAVTIIVSITTTLFTTVVTTLPLLRINVNEFIRASTEYARSWYALSLARQQGRDDMQKELAKQHAIEMQRLNEQHAYEKATIQNEHAAKWDKSKHKLQLEKVQQKARDAYKPFEAHHNQHLETIDKLKKERDDACDDRDLYMKDQLAAEKKLQKSEDVAKLNKMEEYIAKQREAIEEFESEADAQDKAFRKLDKENRALQRGKEVAVKRMDLANEELNNVRDMLWGDREAEKTQERKLRSRLQDISGQNLRYQKKVERLEAENQAYVAAARQRASMYATYSNQLGSVPGPAYPLAPPVDDRAEKLQQELEDCKKAARAEFDNRDSQWRNYYESVSKEQDVKHGNAISEIQQRVDKADAQHTEDQKEIGGLLKTKESLEEKIRAAEARSQSSSTPAAGASRLRTGAPDPAKQIKQLEELLKKKREEILGLQATKVSDDEMITKLNLKIWKLEDDLDKAQALAHE